MTAFIIIGLIIGTISVVVLINDKNKLSTQINKEKEFVFNKIKKIEPTKVFIPNDIAQALLYRDNDKTMHLLDYMKYKEINYKDILQVEIIEDKESVTSTSRSSQLGGAALGGLVLGGTGAIIGGLSGKKKHIETFNEIGLRIIVNDTGSPIHDFSFYNFNKPIKKSSNEFKIAYNEVYEWYKLIEVLIHQADKDEELLNKTAE